MKALKLIIVLLIARSVVCAQDPQFSQYYANKLYLNPAYAGNSFCSNISLNYRNQWVGLPGSFITYSASYDRYVEKLSGGIGVLVTNDQNGEGALTTQNISLIYAYSAALSKNISVKAGFQVTYFQNFVRWGDLKFADMIDGNNGFVNATNDTQTQKYGGGIDVSAGGLVYSEKWFVGFSSHHLTQPEQSFFGYEDSKLLRKYTIHTGGNLSLNESLGDLTISPNLLYQQQGDFRQLNAGLYVKKGPAIMGAWCRLGDAIIVLAGIELDKIKVGYSFDYTISKLGFTPGFGSHEVSLSYSPKCKPAKRKKFRTAQCPSF